MDKYLLEILKSVNTIIIPGLGALTITNHDTGEIMFMPYLKHDDGKLSQYIVENEGLEELDAKNLIAKYVREIQLTLDKGDSYDMFQFGSFFKDGDDIDFKNWEGTTETVKNKPEIPVLEKQIEITEVIEEVIPPVVEENISIISTSSITSINDEVEIPIIEEKISEAPVEKQEPVVLHLKDEIEAPIKEFNILEKEERAATAAKLDQLRIAKEKPAAKKKKGASFWMLMTLIVLIVAGGTYFGLNYNRLKQHVPFLADTSTFPTSSSTTSSKTENSENRKSMGTESEEEKQAEKEIQAEIEPIEVIKEAVVAPTLSTGSDLPFHIIAGAFSSEANATRLGNKLIGEGYTVKIGAGRGMTLVSIKSFSTEEEAQKGLSELKSVAPKAWIYEWK